MNKLILNTLLLIRLQIFNIHINNAIRRLTKVNKISLSSYSKHECSFTSLAALFNVYPCSLILRVVLHSEPAPSAMSALHHFGAEMLRLSRGLEASAATKPQYRGYTNWHIFVRLKIFNRCGNQLNGIYIDYSTGFCIFQFAVKFCIAFYVPVWTCYT